MKARILDANALRGVTPGGLAAYARSAGWAKTEPYGDAADAWHGEGLSEILLPRTDLLGDYPSVVSRLIGIFSEESGQDELAVLKDLLEADHDVIRVRAMEGATNGSIALDTGVEIVSQTREMLLAAACATVGSPQQVYRAGANKEAADFVKRVRLGQTEHGSFVVTLMAPVPPTVRPPLDESWGSIEEEPLSRRVILRLVEALQASRQAAELWNSGSGHQEFEAAVSAGVSANLCDAVAGLIGGTNRLEVSVAWAMNRMPRRSPDRVTFSETYRQPLEEAARTFRARAPRPGTRLVGSVHKLIRDQEEIEGMVTLRAEIDGRIQSVAAVLDEANYGVAIRAHEARNPVIVDGDLERIGQRWRVTNASVRELPVQPDDDPHRATGYDGVE